MRAIGVWVVVGSAAMGGCGSVPKPVPVQVVGDALTRATAHVESADRHVRKAEPLAGGNGRVLLKVASEELALALRGHADAADGVVMVRKELAERAVQVDKIQSDYDRLSGRWYVRWGRWIERVLFWLIVGWAVAGVVAVATGIPLLPWAQKISVELVRLIPVMNPFSWVRNYIRGRQGKPAL